MTLIADVLLIAGAMAAAFYCWILSARVKSLKDLDNGLGAAIAALSGKVDDMQSALKLTQRVTGESRNGIEDMTERAEKAADDLATLLERAEASRRQARTVRETLDPEPAIDEGEIRSGPRVRPSRGQANDDLKADDIPQIDRLGRTEPRQKAPVQAPRSRAEPVLAPPAEVPALTNAEKLQREIRNRIADRDNAGEPGSDDVVATIQSLLVAARK